jgi:hypothetical protein
MYYLNNKILALSYILIDNDVNTNLANFIDSIKPENVVLRFHFYNHNNNDIV